MARDIMVGADEVWDYAHEEESSFSFGLGTSELIAEDVEFGVEIYLSILNDEPYVQVYMDNDLVEEESYSNKTKCTLGVQRIYDDYLSGASALMSVISKPDDEEDEAEPEIEMAEKLDMLDEREQELGDAVDLFLSEVAPNLIEIAGDELDDIYSDVLDLVCEYLYKVRGISVYRPMFLEDDDYEEGFFTEFPYPEIDYDNDEE